MVPFSNQRMSITIVIYTVCDCEDWFSGMKLLILVIFLIQLLVSAGGCSRGVLSLLQLLQSSSVVGDNLNIDVHPFRNIL